MNTKTLISLIILIILGALSFWGWRLYLDFKKSTETIILKEQAPKIEPEKLNELKKLQQPGQPLSPNEPGFGRENPFAPY